MESGDVFTAMRVMKHLLKSDSGVRLSTGVRDDLLQNFYEILYKSGHLDAAFDFLEHTKNYWLESKDEIFQHLFNLHCCQLNSRLGYGDVSEEVAKIHAQVLPLLVPQFRMSNNNDRIKRYVHTLMSCYGLEALAIEAIDEMKAKSIFDKQIKCELLLKVGLEKKSSN